ncbi:MAG: hypothetical protein ABW223_13115, partial [Rariglobus sp.]
MRFFTRLLISAICLGQAHAAPSADDQLKDLVKIIREEIAKNAFSQQAQDQASKEELVRRINSLVDRLEQPASTPSIERVSETVRTLPYLFTSARVTDAGEALLATLDAERDARKALFRTQVEAVLVKASQACLAARTPADLDESLTALSAYQRPSDTHVRDADPVALERASRLFQFVKQWQDYLDARQSGDLNRTTAVLSNLKQSVDPSLFVRSRVLALPVQTPIPVRAPSTSAPVSASSPSRSQLDELVARLETASLDDLEKIAAEPNNRPGENQSDALADDIKRRIQNLVTDRKSLSSGQVSIGLFGTSPLSSQYGVPYPENVTSAFRRLHSQLRDESLRMVFKDSGITPESGEPTDAYIQRVTQAAAAAENWEYALRTLEFYRAFFPGTTAPAWTARELGSCTAYVSARRLDEAGQLPQAILAYHDALRTAGRVTPVKLITARLAAIRENSPESFEAAARLPRPIV